MFLEEGIAIIRKDRTKGLRLNIWCEDYIFFNRNGELKYYFVGQDSEQCFGIKQSYWNDNWIVIDIENIWDVVKRVEFDIHQPNQCGNAMVSSKDIKAIIQAFRSARGVNE